MTKSYLKNLIYQVNGAAIEVHKNIGPGLLESVYHKCMEKELTYRGISFQTELRIPIQYKDFSIEADLKCDLVIEEILIVELKLVKKILQIHEAQILTYMKLLEVPMGLLINFNVTNIYKEGQKTYVNELYRHLED
jgi:hypothetical protein